MRLSFILDAFGGGGKEHRCLQLIQGLLKRGGFDIQVVIIDGVVVYQDLLRLNVALSIINRKEQNKGILKTYREISRAVNEFRPDIVQAWGIMSAFYSLAVTSIHKYHFCASYVADVMSPKTAVEKTVNYLCCKRAEFVVGNSNAGLLAYKIPQKKAVCIYNGFNEDRYQREVVANRKKSELEIDTKYVVSMVASFSKYKDWGCFLEAASIVCAKRSDITFLAVGDGCSLVDYKSKYEEACNGKIKFLGRRNDVDEILQVTDLSVLCTKTDVKEGLSNSIMESMAWGVPVIATQGGGTPEILTDKVNGELIYEQSSHTVSAMIEELIDNPVKRAHYSKQSKRVINDRFLLLRMVDSYCELYRRIVGK